MTIVASGATDIGMKRKTNQDSICLAPEHNFYVVADGMGGHNGGDIASQMSVKLLPEYLAQNPNEDKSELLTNSIKYINQAIYQHGQANQELKGMGTTITGMLISGPEAYIVNVGDSRTYMINKNRLYQMTRDHSLVQEKINLGIYTREEGHRDPQKNVLVRTVGFDPELEVDTLKYKVSPNDMFLICSDGLHGRVSDEDIIYTVNKMIPAPARATQQDLDALVAELIKQANDNGGNDNISVIIVLNCQS